MKKTPVPLLFLLCALSALLFIPVFALAQDAVAPLPPEALGPIQDFIVGLIQKFPWITTVIFVIGALRTLFKPIMTIIESRVKETESADDDKRLADFEAGPIYKAIAWFLDFGASIKIKK